MFTADKPRPGCYRHPVARPWSNPVGVLRQKVKFKFETQMEMGHHVHIHVAVREPLEMRVPFPMRHAPCALVIRCNVAGQNIS